MARLYDNLYGNDNPLTSGQPEGAVPVSTPIPATAAPIPAVYAQPGLHPDPTSMPAPTPTPVSGADPAPPMIDLTLPPASGQPWLQSDAQTPALAQTPPPPQQPVLHAPIPGYPTGPFDRPVDPSTGVPYTKSDWQVHIASDPNAADNTFANRHTDLRRGLASVFAGLTEFAGDRMGRPGMGQQQIQPMLAQAQAQRQWLANRPALQLQSDLEAQKAQAEAGLKQAQASFYGAGGPAMASALRNGYNKFDPVTGQFIPIAPGQMSEVQKAQVNKNNAYLTQNGLKLDDSGNVVPETDRSKLPLQMQSKLDLNDATEALKQAQTELAQAGNDPSAPLFQMKAAALNMAKQRLSLAYAANERANRAFYVKNYNLDPGSGGGVGSGVGVAPSGGGAVGTSAPASGGVSAPAATASGQRVPRGVPMSADGTPATLNSPLQKTFDKTYVVPAQSTEKSYQMMNAAYKEFDDARKAGKTLPTGAQSMLALSTHLQTTFGNVKGARVTKDMIQEHLGARSVSDSALVAIQKLTNGDVLSPDQWDAFHNLISQSRKLSWDQAVSEANRKQLPIDFLPQDLQKQQQAAPKPQGRGKSQVGGKKYDPLGVM